MSTNVHRGEELIYWGEAPTRYFGWYLSSSGDQMSVHPFATAADRDRFVAAVAERMPGPGEAERAAAFAALSQWGGTEADRSWGEDLLAEGYEYEIVEELTDLAMEYQLATRESPPELAGETQPGMALPADVREALVQVVDYCWERELDDFGANQEAGEEQPHHVFGHLVKLNNFLHGENRTPESFLERETLQPGEESPHPSAANTAEAQKALQELANRLPSAGSRPGRER